MKDGSRSNACTRILMVAALAVVAVLSLGMLAACSSDASGNGAAPADEVSMVTKTLVKTAANELVLVDWGVTADDSPLTVSSDDPQYADYIDDLREITGYNIESLTMQVGVTSIKGAEIGATHEFTYENNYTVESLEAVVDSQTITYKAGDFK